MAVSEYKKRQIYQVGQLKPYVLILPVDTTLIDYSIDNGECRVKAIRCTNVYKIEGLGASYSSTETLEGRFKFSNTLTVNVSETNGNTHFSEIAQILKGNYYTIFETNNGDFFMESVDYPVEITYSYSFTNNSLSANVCALSFNSYSNIPTMSIAKEKVPAVTQTIIKNDCKYNVGRVRRLRMCNYKNVLVSQNRNGFFDELSVNGNQSFDDIDFDKSSFSFTETYDENMFKQTITFTIPLSEYKYYWHYNLIEFTNNRYVCIIDTECGNTIISGFDFGFTPTYTIASAEANTSMDTITITLKHIGDCISASNTEGNVIINEDKLTMLSPVNKYTDANGNVHSTTVCISETTGVRTLFEEMTSTGGHTGKYYCLEGYENIYSNLNIVGTYNADDEIGYPIKFNSSECALNHGCQLLQTPPSIVNFTSLGESHTHNIRGECDWHLEGIPSWLTIQPNEGSANNTVSVEMTTAAAPTEEGQTAIVKIVSSDGTYGTFNVNYRTVSSWISPTEFSITAQAQTVTCNILDFNKYSPVSIISNTSGLERWYRDGATIKMDVAENNDYVNQRVITAVAQNKQGKRVTITITQDKLYRRLVSTDEYLCDGNNSYQKMQVYKGYTSDNCNIPTGIYEKGDLILENSPDCGGVNNLYRWYALPNEFVCDGYNKHYKEVYQVSTDGGLTWENVTPLQTRTGQLKEANSIDCGYGITWELVPDKYICEKASLTETWTIIPNEYQCFGNKRYFIEKLQYCYENKCIDSDPLETRISELYDVNESYCNNYLFRYTGMASNSVAVSRYYSDLTTDKTELYSAEKYMDVNYFEKDAKNLPFAYSFKLISKLDFTHTNMEINEANPIFGSLYFGTGLMEVTFGEKLKMRPLGGFIYNSVTPRAYAGCSKMFDNTNLEVIDMSNVNFVFEDEDVEDDGFVWLFCKHMFNSNQKLKTIKFPIMNKPVKLVPYSFKEDMSETHNKMNEIFYKTVHNSQPIETIDFSNIQSIYTDYVLDERGKIRGSIFDVDSSRNLKEIICTQSLADIFHQHPEIILNKTALIIIKN